MLVWLNAPDAGHSRFVFLDRDGVINENRPDYVKNIREFRIYPDALEALRLLSRKGISVIIISNQSGINRGLIRWDDFWEMHEGMIREIEGHGGGILAAFYCPHRPDESCGCRKPSPYMIQNACGIYRIDPGSACFIGDYDTDMTAARGAGCAGVRIRRDPLDRADAPAGGRTYSNLLQAVTGIFG